MSRAPRTPSAPREASYADNDRCAVRLRPDQREIVDAARIVTSEDRATFMRTAALERARSILSGEITLADMKAVRSTLLDMRDAAERIFFDAEHLLQRLPAEDEVPQNVASGTSTLTGRAA